MTLYTLALFAHILGVLALFIGIGLQWISVLRLRQARTAAQAREWVGLARTAGRLSPVAGALIIGSGIAMMVMSWSLTTPWILVSLLAILLMMVANMGVAAQRMKAIGRALAGEDGAAGGSLTQELRQRTHDPALWVATQLAAALALGVVFMMTVKPDVGGSLLTLAVALALGAGVGVATAKPQRYFHAEDAWNGIGHAITTHQLPTAGNSHSRYR